MKVSLVVCSAGEIIAEQLGVLNWLCNNRPITAILNLPWSHPECLRKIHPTHPEFGGFKILFKV